MKLFAKRTRQNSRTPHVNKQKKPQIFSYSSARNSNEQTLNRGESSPANEQNSTVKKLSKAVNIFFFGLILLSAVYLSMLQPNAQIKINGDKVYPREKTSYETGVNARLKGSIFNQNKLTISNDKISAEIKQQFPEVNNAEVKIPFFRHRPIVEVTLAKPIAQLVTSDKTYILDEEGRALFEREFASPDFDTSSLLTINDNSGHQIQLGKPALTENQIIYIREVIGQTSAKGLNAHSFTLSQGGTAMDVRFEGYDYFVKFSFFADARQSSGAFIAVQDQLKKTGASPGQYIDLRVPSKAYVK